MTRSRIARTLPAVVLAVAMMASPLAFGTSPAMASEKIAIVDIQQVFQKTILGKSIQAHLKRFADRRISKMQAEKKSLQEEQGQIRQQEEVISKDALRAKELEFQKKVQDFQKRQQKVQTEIASESFVEFRKFLNAVNKATGRLGKKFDFSLVLSQHPLRVPLGPYPPPFQSPRYLYIKSDADITQSVIKYVNEHASQ
ncbi:MAG: OmpH family outer membrane protein [Leptospirillia bacterium]